MCGASECDSKASIMRRPWPTRGCCALAKYYHILSSVHFGKGKGKVFPLQARCGPEGG